MTLRMGDGPVANLPAGLDAYAGYVDDSGIGVTWPGIYLLPATYHLSISVHGYLAMCGDVESGALNSWKSYDYGYCSADNAGVLIQRDGRPRKLWVAHYTNTPHICSSASCWPSSPVPWVADGTQWTDHGGAWDESLLSDDFFTLDAPLPISLKEASMQALVNPSGQLVVVGAAADNGNLMVFERSGTGWSVTDVTAAIHNENPADPRQYKVV